MTEWGQPETASEWLIALREAPEDEDLRARFADWLAAETENLQSWREISRTYELLGQTTPIPVSDIAERTPKRQPAMSRRAMFGLAGAGIAAAVALYVTIGDAPSYDADYTTATGEDRRIELADGSSLHLGPESAVAVDYSEDRRVVRLFAGEAYFDVVPEPTKPFHVATQSLEARVLGTAFEVQLTEGSTTVAVQEGRVGINGLQGAEIPEHLGAGDWLRLVPGGSLQTGSMPPDQVAAWRNGRLIVRDLSVAEVVSRLRRYHSGAVLLPGERLARRSVTGVYDLTDPIAALRAIASAQGAKLHQFTPWVVVLSEW